MKESRIENLFEKGINYYCNNLEIRPPIFQIPVLGPAIDFIFTTLASEFQVKRFRKTVQILHEEISLIDETKVDFSFLKTEEFYDMLRRFLEISIRSRYEEKTRLYCKVLIGSILLENTDERHSAEDFIIFLSELTLTDIMVAREIYQQQKEMPEKFDIESNEHTELKFIVKSGWHEIKVKCNLNEVDFNISLTKLSRAGLVKEIVGMYLNYTGGLYLITPAFKRLMKIIQYANEPTFRMTS